MPKKSFLYSLAKIILPAIYKILTPYKITRKTEFPKGKVMICCNHVCMNDPFYVAFAHKRQVHYMAKAELFKNKFLGLLIRSAGGFSVSRGASDRSAIVTAEKLLGDGEVLGIFIEGTRSKTGELLRPKSGAALIAYQCACPVLPMCITAKGGGRVRLFTKVRISCGDIITPEELGITTGTSAELRNASRLIMEKITALREKDLENF